MLRGLHFDTILNRRYSKNCTAIWQYGNNFATDRQHSGVPFILVCWFNVYVQLILAVKLFCNLSLIFLCYTRWYHRMPTLELPCGIWNLLFKLQFKNTVLIYLCSQQSFFSSSFLKYQCLMITQIVAWVEFTEVCTVDYFQRKLYAEKYCMENTAEKCCQTKWQTVRGTQRFAIDFFSVGPFTAKPINFRGI